ncbi:2Fe-2S iron-sulfur cluster binding domain-containing protein [Sinimarinibacterium sp. CAU 1509]|uniref:2Fe-2S iron-sulfur cluster-binding protein n=1 Tax=Sinimarinibacterium sp. CAU 1509 TaxID=2562283 RepID=UPI0010ABF4BC|nr:2Fe-2S iron-sulfur cluster-binding protein [Sinimarinibacterium sp. CAU 1509]TJY64694.1 2Fe-2S iron-sulfur cluster binding domain-containing protein [Sinimarinibacterium sp. CAU 1509]
MSYRVYLSDRPQSFTVEPDETILQAGLRQHLALPFGCQSGGCASCRVRLLDGNVAHRLPPPALSTAEIDAGYILMCLAQPQSDLRIDLHQPADLDALRPQIWPCRVQMRSWLAHDVLRLQLKLPKGKTLHYLPGQYIDLLLDDGRRRSFSIANAPNGEFIELHVRVTPGGRFAQWAAHEMPDRAMLRFEGPLGAFYLREDTRPIVMIAGGTGIAPLRAMLQSLLPQSQRPVHLYWGVRAQRDLYLDAELTQLAQAHPQFAYRPVLSEPDTGWNGATGFVHAAALRDHADLHTHAAYLSGPPAMVRAGKDAFIAAGGDPDQLFYDAFDYAFETWPGVG